ncbi:hypothetical protein B566_EDAN010998 [Ephemera danica]|nr:hypothetical protein B566_EDAN010998 [Ephemera danica]
MIIFSSMLDPQTILAEESAKESCKRHHQFGECPFGANCKFSHYSRQDLDALRHYGRSTCSSTFNLAAEKIHKCPCRSKQFGAPRTDLCVDAPSSHSQCAQSTTLITTSYSTGF